MNTNKYKSVLCKHFGQTGTCSYGDKCQFAHGYQELKNSSSSFNQNDGKRQPANPSNFKIVKCKNWDQNGSCKYGSVCTFAHGDTEVRTKSDNNLQMSENAITLDTMVPTNMSQYLMNDPNYIYNLMLQQQMMEMQGGQNQNTQYMGLNSQNIDTNQVNYMNQYNQMNNLGNMNTMNTNLNMNNMNMNNNLNMMNMNSLGNNKIGGGELNMNEMNPYYMMGLNSNNMDMNLNMNQMGMMNNYRSGNNDLNNLTKDNMNMNRNNNMYNNM